MLRRVSGSYEQLIKLRKSSLKLQKISKAFKSYE